MPHRKRNQQQQPRQWRRIDLHLHTPASIDYKQPNVTYLDLLRKAEEKNLDVIAFTDHNTATGYARYLEEVESLELLERLGRLRDDERQRLEEYRRLRDEILILPGFEFTATLGFHILGIFPPDTTVRELEHLLLLLRVPPDKLDQGSGEVGATTDALTAYRMINEAGGIVIAAHANSSHGVAMPGFDFGGQTRIAYTQDPNLNALEVTDLESKSRRRTAAFFSGTKPEYPRRMHCIQGSDAHKLDFDPRYKNESGVGDRATEILIDDCSFEAIRDVFLGNDFSLTRPYRPATEEPFDPIRAAREQGDSLVQAFHERFHEKKGVGRPILEDVVALANTNGGTIYIGANANVKSQILGIDRPEQASAELRSAISKEVTPPLEVQVDVVKSQNKNLLQVIVPRGSEVPYALEGTYIYVRSENETGLAMRDEVVQLVRDALAVEMAASGAAPAPVDKPAHEPAAETAQPAAEPARPALVPSVEPPRTGVEIVTSEVRKGVTYYSVRDLRNNRIVQNVTRASARRLWQYAIEEQEKHSCDPTKVTWIGTIGMCKNHKRGGKMRYDLVQRVNGSFLIYYGVTEDGIHGEWRKLVEGENGNEPEEIVEGETRSEVGAPAEIGAESEPPTLGEPAASSPEFESSDKSDFALPETFSPERMAAEQREEPEETAEPFREEPPTLPQSYHAGTLSWHQEQSEEAESPSGEAEEGGESHETMPWDLTSDLTRDETYPQTESGTPDQDAKQAAEESTGEAELPSPRQPEPPAPAQAPEPQPLKPPASQKSRAQEWREVLDRAIAEARAAQQAARARDENTGDGTPSSEPPAGQ